MSTSPPIPNDHCLRRTFGATHTMSFHRHFAPPKHARENSPQDNVRHIQVSLAIKRLRWQCGGQLAQPRYRRSLLLARSQAKGHAAYVWAKSAVLLTRGASEVAEPKRVLTCGFSAAVSSVSEQGLIALRERTSKRYELLHKQAAAASPTMHTGRIVKRGNKLRTLCARWPSIKVGKGVEAFNFSAACQKHHGHTPAGEPGYRGG